jgi:hypothetical protein
VWVKLDDGLPDNPKVEELSDGAFRLYVSALCHAQRHLTDGHIKDSRVNRLIPRFKPAYIAELVDAQLWEPNGTGYLIHDFAAWNKTRTYWEGRRADDARRKAEWRARKESEE